MKIGYLLHKRGVALEKRKSEQEGGWWDRINMSGHGKLESDAFTACFGKELEREDFEAICNWAESIVKKELAEKVDEWQMSFDVAPSHPSGEWYSVKEFEDAVESMVSHVLSLLTDKGKEQ